MDKSENKMLLLFATANPNKAKEVRQMLSDDAEIFDLNDIQLEEELKEEEETLEGNALSKAKQALAISGLSACFAEDTGLEVLSLDGAPGVHSARYSGEERSNEKNIRKLLSELENKTDRTARFRTVIAYLDGKGEFLFEGVVNGRIAEKPCGQGGFGYDPVFIPDGYDQTFAEISSDEKNRISHRGRAFQAFFTWFKENS